MKVHIITKSEEFLPTQKRIEEIKEYAEVEVHIHTGSIAELEIDGEEVILALDPDSCEWDLDAEAVLTLGTVKAVCISSTSFDWVKPAILKQQNIPIYNVPGASSDAVAEYCLAMSIELARHLSEVFQQGWKPLETKKLRTLKGKTLGIIGLGNIGTRVAEVFSGIGMHVTYWSKNTRDERFTYKDIDHIFSESDLIIPTLVESEETKQLFSDKRLDSVKKDALWIGINRIRQLWNQDRLIQKVKDGQMGGYAFEGEEALQPNDYQGNIWAVPPIAWQSQDTLNNYMDIWADSIVGFLKGKPVHPVE